MSTHRFAVLIMVPCSAAYVHLVQEGYCTFKNRGVSGLFVSGVSLYSSLHASCKSLDLKHMVVCSGVCTGPCAKVSS